MSAISLHAFCTVVYLFSIICIAVGIWLACRNVTRSVAASTAQLRARLTETEIAQSEEKYRTLFETVPALICRLAPAGEVVFVNGFCVDVLGYTVADTLGKNWWALLYPDALGDQKKTLFEALDHRDELHDHRMTLVNKNGALRTISWNVRARRNPSSYQLEELLLAGTDITERKRYEDALTAAEKSIKENELKLRAIFTCSPIGIEYFDAEGNLQDANPAAIKIFNEVGAVKPHPYNVFKDPKVPAEIIQRLRRGETVSFTYEINFEEPSMRHTKRLGRSWISVVVVPLDIKGYLVHVQEICKDSRGTESK